MTHKKTRLFVIAVLSVFVIFASACGRVGLELDGGSPSLVGTWYWLSEPYYVFNEDGSGTMSFMPINWGARNGVLAVCSTPIICRGRCIGASMWDYEIVGNRLILTSQLTSRISFEYFRRP